jgi:hypothetical protein
MGCAQNGEPLPPNETKLDPESQVGTLPQAPAPREKTGRENWPNSLVGKWKRIGHNYAAELTSEFTANGILTERTKDRDGERSASVEYKLVGDTFVVPEPPVQDNVITRNETSERTTYIESLSDEKLVTVTIVRRRWTPKRAAEIAKSRMIPVEQLLSEVREERHTATYERVK